MRFWGVQGAWMIKAQPGNVGIKGADRGLDGRLHFGKTGIVRVKAGENMGVSVIRDQKGAMERERGRDRHLPDPDRADQAHVTFDHAPCKEAPNRQGARDL